VATTGQGIDIGVGAPAMFRRTTRELLLDWARRAEAAGFSSLSGGERLGYENDDLMMLMAMIGAATERIRMMTTVLVLPLHSPTVIAKQTVTLHHLTGGRFDLGVGTGGRTEDYALAGVEWRGHMRRYGEQLETLRAVFDGKAPTDDTNPVGPVPDTGRPPRLLMGTTGPKGIDLTARFGDGLSTFGFDASPPPQVAAYERLQQAWAEHGRSGRPAFVSGTYFALGPDAEARAAAYVHDYYGYMPTEVKEAFISTLAVTSPDAAARAVAAFAEAGADELYFTPMIPEPDQVDRLAEATGLA
jgi:alkanesulfonate monooxygenase SsuD/methylene tetrahydromethanopterin reductase-like flavin-dependent oxidoreductase (luciferase family)